MPNINQLSSSTTLGDGDVIPVFSDANQDTRKVSLPFFVEYIRQSLEGERDETIYDVTTSGRGFTVRVVPNVFGGSVWVQLTLSSPAASGTVVLPDFDNRDDNQEVLVTATQSVAALTVSGNGAAVRGAPTSLLTDGFFKLRFDRISTTWFRVG